MTVHTIHSSRLYFQDGWFTAEAPVLEFILEAMLATRGTLEYTADEVNLYLEQKGCIQRHPPLGKTFHISNTEKLLGQLREAVQTYGLS